VQLQDLFPRRTGARFIASLAAVFDLDFHELILQNADLIQHPQSASDKARAP